MVFDKPRLPGVQVRREGLAYRNTDGEEAPRDARHLGLNPCTSHSHTERRIRNARHVDLSEASSRCYPDPRSGTELLVAA
jgi:hypothetical protein